MPPVLWQVPNSIFCEKVAWALDRKGVAYATKDLPPGLHSAVLAVRRRGTTVPVLELDGRAIPDSTAIVAALEERHPDPPLYPSDPAQRREALAVEDHFDEHVGHDVRRVGLDRLLHHPALFGAAFMSGLPRPARAAALATHRVSDAVTRRKYGVADDAVARAREAVDDAFSYIERRAAPGDFLVGDALSVADITAASLLSPVVMPEAHPTGWWRGADLPADVVALREELTSRPGGEWVRETYRRWR